MKKAYSYSTKNFEAISYGSDYLYQKYEPVESLLKKYLGQSFQSKLAKPVITNDEINWYTIADTGFKELSAFDTDTIHKIKTEYEAHKKDIASLIHNLESNNERNWSELLRSIYFEPSNQIIYNGHSWFILWGWKNKKGVTYTDPDYPEPIHLSQDGNLGNSGNENITSVIGEQDKPKVADELKDRGNTKSRRTINHRIVRFLRFYTYRFFGWLLFIILLLILLCLCRTFCIKNIEQELTRIDSLNTELIKIEKKLIEKCK